MSESSKIALATLDNDIYCRVVQELKNRKIKFIVCKPEETIPLSTKVVITTQNEYSKVKHHTVFICGKNNIDETLNQALNKMRGTENNHQKIIIGVDPGKTIGLAVVSGEGIVLKTAKYAEPNEIFKAIIQSIKEHNIKELEIKIGKRSRNEKLSTDSEAGEINRKIYKLTKVLVKKYDLKVQISFIDERYTTAIVKRMKVKRLEKDQKSAVKIALR